MRRTQTLAITALLIAAMFPLAGCSQWLESPAKPANDAIEVANGHLEAAAELEEEVQSTVASLDSLPLTKDGAGQGLEITAELRETIAAERTELESAKAAMDGIAALDVADEYKEYATLESAAIDTRITLTDTTLRLFDAMDVLYTALKKTSSDVEPQQVQTIIAQVKQELEELSTQAADQAQTARDFFRDNRLGS